MQPIWNCSSDKQQTLIHLQISGEYLHFLPFIVTFNIWVRFPFGAKYSVRCPILILLINSTIPGSYRASFSWYGDRNIWTREMDRSMTFILVWRQLCTFSWQYSDQSHGPRTTYSSQLHLLCHSHCNSSQQQLRSALPQAYHIQSKSQEVETSVMRNKRGEYIFFFGVNNSCKLTSSIVRVVNRGLWG